MYVSVYVYVSVCVCIYIHVYTYVLCYHNFNVFCIQGHPWFLPLAIASTSAPPAATYYVLRGLAGMIALDEDFDGAVPAADSVCCTCLGFRLAPPGVRSFAKEKIWEFPKIRGRNTDPK